MIQELNEIKELSKIFKSVLNKQLILLFFKKRERDRER